MKTAWASAAGDERKRWTHVESRRQESMDGRKRLILGETCHAMQRQHDDEEEEQEAEHGLCLVSLYGSTSCSLVLGREMVPESHNRGRGSEKALCRWHREQMCEKSLRSCLQPDVAETLELEPGTELEAELRAEGRQGGRDTRSVFWQ
ncbi:hypothetical protein UVI_02031010 [Ustilaginoidea virens]|uniref:Uncharacterized protein n=1 Tax=Ustilaginoidea virens TaxID=1159556 RepID=A0A1B5L3T4_USTVR|nr:hypothetical protein UVI_02031010 [Ustilaginoidea virens]